MINEPIYIYDIYYIQKSALTIRLVTDNFLEEYDPTIEDSYCKQVPVDGVPALLDILDTAGVYYIYILYSNLRKIFCDYIGQEEFSSMQDQWMREGQGFLLVYSITNAQTFDEVETLREKILRTKDDDGDNVPIVLCGNKCDLENDRQISKEQGQQLADQWKCKFYETSAKMKINHQECFFEIVRQIRKPKPGKKPKQEDKKPGFCNIL